MKKQAMTKLREAREKKMRRIVGSKVKLFKQTRSGQKYKENLWLEKDLECQLEEKDQD